MTFRKCRRCGYAFVPEGYTACPKCNASVAMSREAKLMLKGALIAGVALAAVAIAVFILPHISIAYR